MDEFSGRDLKGARFDDVDLSGSHFRAVDLSRARMHDVYLTGVRITAAAFEDVDLEGWVSGLRVNGIDVGPLVEHELDRRHPNRAKMRPTDPDGFRHAWEILEELWGHTVDRARSLPPELLHARADTDEWSFIETLRHLAFATDAWVRRAILGDPTPWHPLDLPHDEMPDLPGVPRDRDVRPSLDEVMDVRAERVAVVRRLLDGLTQEQLDSMTDPVTEPGYPESESFPVKRCLLSVLNEEWQHRLYAERDLDRLTHPERNHP